MFLGRGSRIALHTTIRDADFAMPSRTTSRGTVVALVRDMATARLATGTIGPIASRFDDVRTQAFVEPPTRAFVDPPTHVRTGFSDQTTAPGFRAPLGTPASGQPLPAMLRPARLPTAPGASVVDLARVVLAIGQERTLAAAVDVLQREAKRLTRSIEALVVVIDWARLTCWTTSGQLTDPAVHELVTGVAGSGRGRVIGTCALEPIGRTPAHAVIAIRRPAPYADAEIATLIALSRGCAPTLARLARLR